MRYYFKDGRTNPRKWDKPDYFYSDNLFNIVSESRDKQYEFPEGIKHCLETKTPYIHGSYTFEQVTEDEYLLEKVQ